MDGVQTVESFGVEELVYEPLIRTKEDYTYTGKFIFTKTKMMLVSKKQNFFGTNMNMKKLSC
ncbi:hypothetical protein ACN95T_002168 [Listeria monocytogenes]|uniref:hypothetical protein n=1 Tax=Listeria monocytogenes TaxID=1639 RepID=UPI00016961B4|nr:hypothetical protein [Listeria monocytogenes]EAC5142250.1 hypothetical protein [Listeria monocytogenes]EAC7686989.1 hypothetical protein [Listeria monocytogenes]EAC7907255.1 hypothetical protein [Listeria monocytogenes]EAC8075775.1 hypothetical protein [Listeria monocytogenes]EAC9017342.1 hypothetical protein [Listeria monocytogenes]